MGKKYGQIMEVDCYTCEGIYVMKQLTTKRITNECLKCRAARKLAKAVKVNRGLNSLIGTEKQIDFAEVIRARFVKKANKIKAKLLVDYNYYKNSEIYKGLDINAERYQRAIERAIINVRDIPQAKIWIENRENLEHQVRIKAERTYLGVEYKLAD